MSFVVTSGIKEDELRVWLANAAKKYGTFNDGRVNYTSADMAPIVMCTVKYDNKILIVKRGYGLADAEGYWSTVNGFIDEPKKIKQQAAQELEEELQLKVNLSQISVKDSYTLSNPQEKRKYIIFPCLVTLLEEPTIVLDYENTEYKWINRQALNTYHILDDLSYAIDSALGIITVRK